MHTPIHADDTHGLYASTTLQDTEISLATAASEHILAALNCLAELAERSDSLALLRVLAGVADQLEDARQDTATLGGFLRGRADVHRVSLPM